MKINNIEVTKYITNSGNLSVNIQMFSDNNSSSKLILQNFDSDFEKQREFVENATARLNSVLPKALCGKNYEEVFDFDEYMVPLVEQLIEKDAKYVSRCLSELFVSLFSKSLKISLKEYVSEVLKTTPQRTTIFRRISKESGLVFASNLDLYSSYIRLMQMHRLEEFENKIYSVDANSELIVFGEVVTNLDINNLFQKVYKTESTMLVELDLDQYAGVSSLLADLMKVEEFGAQALIYSTKNLWSKFSGDFVSGASIFGVIVDFDSKDINRFSILSSLTCVVN